MKLGGFAITAVANSLGGKNYCDSSIMPAGAMAPVRMASPGVLPRPGRNIYTTGGLSLGLTSCLDGQREMSRTAENDPSKAMEEEYESRSGSDNLDVASADEQDPAPNRNGKKRYHRHKPIQIQEMEAFFKECPHPDENQRLDLSKRLNLHPRQVKFWFQNRRTQMKAQQERHDNNVLRHENERLRAENITIREAIKNALCPTCGGPTIIEMSIEEQQLRFENARMREELERLYAVNGKAYSSRSLLSAVPFSPTTASSLDYVSGVASLGSFQGGSSRDLVRGASLQDMPLKSSLLSDVEKEMVAELAIVALEEFLKLADAVEPLWVLSSESGKETLDFNEYLRQFPRGIGPKPAGFMSEASRETGVVIMSGLSMVEAFLDADRWVEMFSCIVARADIGEVISVGSPITRDGALQLMYAELQSLSPFGPIRELYFIRFCKMLRENTWVVVDVSVDNLRGDPPSKTICRKRPSGCLIQELPNGYSKVSWIEHSEFDCHSVHRLYRSLVSSGMVFGAQRWLATLQRQCERLASIMATHVACREPGGIPTPEGRCSMLKLAHRMTSNFCASVSTSTLYKWATLSGSNGTDEVKVITRKGVDNPYSPSDSSGNALCAATSVLLPVLPQRLFEFLRNEHLRKEWDILSMGGPMEEMIHIPKGHDPGNNVSLLRASDAGASNMLILQECCTDVSGSLVVYAPVDIPNMNAVMSGRDPNFVTILPSGFVILPDGPEFRPLGLLDVDGSLDNARVGGSLLTVAFQILVNTMPGSRLTLESIGTVNSLVSSTVQKIKHALGCEDT